MSNREHHLVLSARRNPISTLGYLRSVILSVSVLVIYLITRFPASQFREPVFQAWAFLHRHLYMVDGWSPEGVIYNNRAYLIHPPLSAVAMLPSVLLQGLNANQSLVCVLLGVTGVILVARLTNNLWLTSFFAFGTIFWYESILGSQWGMCLVLSVIPTTLALIGVREKWSPYLVGLCAGIAFLARYDLALAWPVYLCLID